MIDLASLDTKTPAEAGVVVQLDNPFTGEPLTLDDGSPCTITVLGQDSAKMRAYTRQVTDRNIERLRKGRDAMKSEAAEADRIGGLATVTTAWNLFPLDGQTLDCTERNAKKLYSDPRFPWIVEQLEKAVMDRARFFPRASSN